MKAERVESKCEVAYTGSTQNRKGSPRRGACADVQKTERTRNGCRRKGNRVQVAPRAAEGDGVVDADWMLKACRRTIGAKCQ